MIETATANDEMFVDLGLDPEVHENAPELTQFDLALQRRRHEGPMDVMAGVARFGSAW